MRSFKQSLSLILFAGLSIGNLYAATEKATEKKRWLADRVMQFKVNRDLLRQHQQHQLPLTKQELENLRAKQRQILRQVAKAGAITAFLIAIGAITAVAAKKYGEGKAAPAAPKPSFEAMHKGYAPPGQSAPSTAERVAQEVREIPRAPMPAIGNGEEVKHWTQEQEAYEESGLYDIGDIGQ